MPDPLQGGENFDDHRAAFVERFLKKALLLVERLETSFGRLDACFDAAHARGGIDELLVERAPIVAERLDLAFELGLVFRRLALLGARRFEFLIALLESIRIGRRRSGRRRLRREVGHRTAARPALAAGGLAGGVWASAAGLAPSGSAKRQGGAEHKARIGAARPTENHRVQG